jgi:hypothetical protein
MYFNSPAKSHASINAHPGKVTSFRRFQHPDQGLAVAVQGQLVSGINPTFDTGQFFD